MTGALWAKRGERDISRGARHDRLARDEGKRKIKGLKISRLNGTRALTSVEGGKGGIVIPFHAQILTKFTRHVSFYVTFTRHVQVLAIITRHA